jgi:uncharacterized membrane protein YphA (DoxX/SURF4 family)
VKASIKGIRDNWVSWTLVWLTRFVLAILFVPTGLRKLLGIPFSRGFEPWAAFFFDALYAAGPYWRFLGLCEVAAGLLLLIPRLAFLGALMYAAIATNLLVIGISLDMLPDVIISTSVMLLASIALILWDWPKLTVLVSTDDSPRASLRGSFGEAWANRKFRIAAGGVVILWIIVHLLDRAGML